MMHLGALVNSKDEKKCIFLKKLVLGCKKNGGDAA